MKKVLISILATVALLAFNGYSADATARGTTITVKDAPGNITGYVLHSRNTAASVDTFAAQDNKKVYGPYPLAKGNGDNMASGFAVMADVITGTTPVMAFDYQVIAGKLMTDTVNSWTAACTLGTAGVNSYFNLASKAGEAIVFRINNYDATASQIPGLVKVYIKE